MTRAGCGAREPRAGAAGSDRLPWAFAPRRRCGWLKRATNPRGMVPRLDRDQERQAYDNGTVCLCPTRLLGDCRPASSERLMPSHRTPDVEALEFGDSRSAGTKPEPPRSNWGGDYLGVSENMFQKLYNEDGASAVEYGLLIAIIALAVGAAAFVLGPRIGSAFQSGANCIDTPTAAECTAPGGATP